MKSKIIQKLKGKNALITGGSSGIGLEFSRQLAAQGINIVIIGRNNKKLLSATREIKEKYNVKTESLSIDLSKPGASQKIFNKFPDIDLLINNAGFGIPNSISGCNINDESEIINLNCIAPMQLSALYLPQMINKSFGCLILVSSVLAFSGAPFMANYSSTKAYLLSLGEGIKAETKKQGIYVQVLCPGPTNTPGASKHVVDYSKIPISQMTSQDVVKFSLSRLGSGLIQIPGCQNRLASSVMRCEVLKSISTLFIEKIAKKALSKN